MLKLHEEFLHSVYNAGHRVLPMLRSPISLEATRIKPDRLVNYGSLLGVVMMALGWVGRRDTVWFPPHHWLLDLGIGLGCGTSFALLAWRLADHVTAMRNIKVMLIQTLDMDALRWYHAPIFGLIAGIPEEMLFRGAIQPWVGLIAASLVFGVLHAINRAYFIYATMAGLLLGGLMIWRGGLWSPIAAHFAVDAVMFGLLMVEHHKDKPC
jgi:membrane protease YdiL (CAAX protease family)